MDLFVVWPRLYVEVVARVQEQTQLVTEIEIAVLDSMKSCLEHARLVTVLELVDEGVLLLILEDCGEYYGLLSLLLWPESLDIQHLDWVKLSSELEELEVQFASNLLENVWLLVIRSIISLVDDLLFNDELNFILMHTNKGETSIDGVNH